MARTSKAELETQALAALERAVVSLGHAASTTAGDEGADLVVTIDGTSVPVSVEAVSVVTPEGVTRITAPRSQPRKDIAKVLVGDLITEAARGALSDAGWGWLDRRGHLRLRAKGVHIDTTVGADERMATRTSPKPISGVAGLSWATALLLEADDPPSMRAVARRVSLSHSTIVTAARRLREASLVQTDGRPLVPELFWVLADAWQPRRVALAELPAGAAGVAGVPGADQERSGKPWAVAGTVGASAWGAPVTIRSGYPPDFYAASPTDVRRAVLRLGEATRFEDRACTVAVAPTPLVFAESFDRENVTRSGMRVAHGLFAALDLAQDRARGVEILDEWHPEEFARVW